MRMLGLVPILASIAACALGFLCIFAGSRTNFMESYNLINVNTTRVGQSVFDTSDADEGDSQDRNLLTGLIHNVTDRVSDWVTDNVEDGLTGLARKLGIQDFYSVHMLDYCTGWYVSHGTSNDTDPSNSTLANPYTDKQVTNCSERTVSFQFDLRNILEEDLRDAGVALTLEDLQFPSVIQDTLDTMAGLFMAAFVLFCIGVGFSFFAMLFPLWFILGYNPAGRGRVAALVNLVIALLAFLAYLIASAMTTAMIVKSTNVINNYTDRTGIDAQRGTKFMGISWAATGLMFLSAVIWCAGCVIGRGKKTRVVKEG